MEVVNAQKHLGASKHSDLARIIDRALIDEVYLAESTECDNDRRGVLLRIARK